MKTYLKLIAASLAVFLIFSAALNKIKSSKISTSKKLYPIVRLTQDGRTFCSGTVINDHTIVSAAHCMPIISMFGMIMLDTNPIEIKPFHNQSIGVFGTPYYIDPRMDLALIKGDFSMFEPQPYTSDITTIVGSFKLGRRMVACGYPMNGDLYCAELYFYSTQEFSMKVRGLLLPGMSGGPTMLEDGTVIGVNTAVTDEFSIISPIYNINKNIK